MQLYVPQYRLRNLDEKAEGRHFDAFLEANRSPLAGLGNFIKDCSECYKINEVFVLALAIHESGWGNSRIAQDKNNLCGWGAVDADPYEGAWRFHTKEGCLMTVCKYLDRSYLTRKGKYYKGGTIADVGKVYASDKKWADKICHIMNRIEIYVEQNP